ncbi:hypothetical protein ACIRON_20590 [Nocardioides sp. NPDC101246]|uniref:hypothetical protein n=1 Tax=Nocardioides sp. NPDC101246 TaxID=3364336 RepID=UPI0037FAE821
MKTRVLKATVGLAAVLGGLLIAGPAQAADGPVSARVYAEGSSGSGGIARADIDFTSQRGSVFFDFTVRDVCPGDNLPVRAYIKLVGTGGEVGLHYVGSDTNGCGADGTNFGNISVNGSSPVAKAGVRVCVYNSTGNLRCKEAFQDNPYT